MNGNPCPVLAVMKDVLYMDFFIEIVYCFLLPGGQIQPIYAAIQRRNHDCAVRIHAESVISAFFPVSWNMHLIRTAVVIEFCDSRYGAELLH